MAAVRNFRELKSRAPDQVVHALSSGHNTAACSSAANTPSSQVEDALLYLDQVKAEFGDRPEIYNEFLEIMKSFKSQEIDTPGVIERVSTLFKGYGKLIYGFNTFLPEGYKIDVPIELREQLRGEVARPQGRPMLEDKDQGQPPTSAFGSGPGTAQSPERTNPFFGRVAELTRVTGFGKGSGPVRGGAPGGKGKGPAGMERGPQPSVKAQQGRYADDEDMQQPQQGSMSGQQRRQPPEFDNAIAYVTAIKKRFEHEPETYKAFLEVLHTYQREQKGIQDVLRRVAELFKDHADLLREFTYFLPDAAIEPAQRLFLQRAADDADQRNRQARREAETRQLSPGKKELSSSRQAPGPQRASSARGGPQRQSGPGVPASTVASSAKKRQTKHAGEAFQPSSRPGHMASSAKSPPAPAPRPKKRGASLASLRSAAAAARATAREIIKRQEREAAIENAPRVEEKAVLKRLRLALLGDEGARLFPPDDPRLPWRRPGRRAKIVKEPLWREWVRVKGPDDFIKRKPKLSEITDFVNGASAYSSDEDDIEALRALDVAAAAPAPASGTRRRQPAIVVRQPAARSSARTSERESAWRDVLKVIDAVSRGALTGEAVALLLGDVLADVVDWGGRESGRPSGHAFARDVAALATKSSRLAPTIECVSQSLALARRAMTPGLDPDPALLKADVERAQAYARFQAGSRRSTSSAASALLIDSPLGGDFLVEARVASAAAQLASARASDKAKAATATRANTRRQRGAGVTVATRASSPAPTESADDRPLSEDDAEDYDDELNVKATRGAPPGRASRSAAKSPPRAIPAAMPKGGLGDSAFSKLLASSSKFPGDWTSLPLSELDFDDDDDDARTTQRSPSYRRLPDSVPRAVCSHRTETDASVLNDDYVSVATTSDDANYSQLQLRRNAHEEALFKAEDEHFEIDMVVNANAAAIRALEAIARHGGAKPFVTDNYDDARSDIERFLAVPSNSHGSVEGAAVLDDDWSRPKRGTGRRGPSSSSLASRPRRGADDTQLGASRDDRKRGLGDGDHAESSTKRHKSRLAPVTETAAEEALVAGPQPMERRCLSPIHLAAICRVYGDRDVDALKALERSPAVAARVIADRLREKDLEWRATRRGLARRWRRRCRAHFAKSLDHRAHFWRALDKKRCSAKWLVQEIKDINDDDDDDANHTGGVGYAADDDDSRRARYQPPPPLQLQQEESVARAALRYDVSCAEIRRDAFKVLMLALESSSTPVTERRLVARSVWRDFAAELLAMPAQWLARHLPPSLSRVDVETRFAELAARSGAEIEDDDSGFILGSRAKQIGDELRVGSRVLTPYGEGVVADRRPPDLAALKQQQSEQQRLLVEIADAHSASYDVRYPWGRAFIRPRDVFALDEPGTAVVDDPDDPFAALLAAPQPTDVELLDYSDDAAAKNTPKRGRPPRALDDDSSFASRVCRAGSVDSAGSAAAAARRTRRRTPDRSAGIAAGKGSPDGKPAAALLRDARFKESLLGKSVAALRGRVLANEKMYVFARLYQMIYDRLADARRLCVRESERKERQAQEPHDVIDAVAADEQGEPPADSESDDDGAEDGDIVCPPPKGTSIPAANGAATNGKGPPLSLSPLCDFDDEIQRCCQKGYAGFLELVAMLLCGDVNKTTFDDACRELLGNDGYRVRAIDRLARATVDAMRALATDDVFKTLRDIVDDDPPAILPNAAKRVSARRPATAELAFDGTCARIPKPREVNAFSNAVRRELVAAAPTMAGEDLYRVSIGRDNEGNPLELKFEYLGTLPEDEDEAKAMA